MFFSPLVCSGVFDLRIIGRRRFDKSCVAIISFKGGKYRHFFLLRARLEISICVSYDDEDLIKFSLPIQTLEGETIANVFSLLWFAQGSSICVS